MDSTANPPQAEPGAVAGRLGQGRRSRGPGAAGPAPGRQACMVVGVVILVRSFQIQEFSRSPLGAGTNLAPPGVWDEAGSRGDGVHVDQPLPFLPTTNTRLPISL